MLWTNSAPCSPSRSKPTALRQNLVLSAYYVAPGFGSLRSETGRRQFSRPFLQRNETNAPQVRSEIWNRPPHQQNFAVQRGDEAGYGHAFEGRDLLQDVPEYP